jgi:hypothetical protein
MSASIRQCGERFQQCGKTQVKKCQMSKNLRSVVFTGCIPTVCRTVPPYCHAGHHAGQCFIDLANGISNPISMLNQERSQHNGEINYDSMTRHGQMSASQPVATVASTGRLLRHADEIVSCCNRVVGFLPVYHSMHMVKDLNSVAKRIQDIPRLVNYSLGYC